MIELPRDAKGREIPLDVDALYDKNGNRVEVFRWNYVRGRNNNWTFNRLLEFVTVPLYPQDYFLTPPDSLEKLEDDLSKIVNHPEKVVCAYFDRERKDCDGCKLKDCEGSCSHACLEDIITRIHKLRGEGE